MSFYHSPKIVTDGLVLSLDAGNTKSYPGTGTVWINKATSINNGTLINGPAYSASGLGSILFDGTDDYASLGQFPGLGSINRTIEVWFQILSLSPSGNRRIFTLAANDSSTDSPACTIGYTTLINSLSLGCGGFPYDGYVLNMPFQINEWICLSGVFTGNNVAVYKNAILMGTVTNSGSIGADPIGFVSRYNQHYGQYGNVRVPAVKIYSRSLSFQETQQNFNALRGRFGI